MDLVPIRIDIEANGQRLRDNFLWNHHEEYISPETFAEITCRDLALSVHHFKPLIVSSINEQVGEYNTYNGGSLFESTIIIVRLDITVGYTNLVDQFEWTLDGTQSPEQMASITVKELGLDPEFRSAIAYSIREQCLWIKRALTNAKYTEQDPNSVPLEMYEVVIPPRMLEHEIRHRLEQDRFSPKITELTPTELANIEAAGERESRRLRKQHRTRRSYDSLTVSPRIIWTLTGKRSGTTDDPDKSVLCSQCHKSGPYLSMAQFKGHYLCLECRKQVSFG